MPCPLCVRIFKQYTKPLTVRILINELVNNQTTCSASVCWNCTMDGSSSQHSPPCHYLWEPMYNMTHVDIIHYHAIYCRSERRAAGGLPLALGPAFTQGAPTICIIATPARTTDKQASGRTQQDTTKQPPRFV